MSVLKVTFVTTVDRNPGDAFIRAGIEYLLQQHIPYYQPIYVDKHEYKSPRRGFPKIKRLWPIKIENDDPFSSADIIVQAGTPFYYIIPGPDGTYTSSFFSSVSTDWIRKVWLEKLLRLAKLPPVLNLAVGTCQSFSSDASEFDRSPELLAFIRKTVELSALTTVRERIAARLLDRCSLPSHCLPCAAIFAADYHRIYPEQPSLVCLNYMDGGAHYTLGQTIDFEGWERAFLAVYRSLNQRYSVVVMCHSPGEVLRVRSLIPEADTFFSSSYQGYLRVYAKARFGIFNRVHGAMVLAGMGRPAVVVGNDTRARMAELMELPTYFVNEATPDCLLEHVVDFEEHADTWSGRLLAIKVAARKQYLRLLHGGLSRVLPLVAGSPGYQRSDLDRAKRFD